MRIPIVAKLAVAILIPLGGLVSLFMFEEFQRRKHDARTDAEALLAEQARGLAARLDAELQRAGTSASAIAGLMETVKSPDEQELWKIVRRSVERDSVTFGCCIAFEPGTFAGKPGLFAPYAHRLIGPDNKTIRTSAQAFDIAERYDYTEPTPEHDWYVTPRRTGQPTWTEPYFDAGGGETQMVTFAVPFTSGGGVAGVATSDVRLQDLQALADQLSVPEVARGDREVFIVTGKGKIISTAVPGMLDPRDMRQYVRETGREDVRELARRMMARETGSVLMPELRGDGDERVLISFAKLPSMDASLGTSIPERDVLAGPYRELKHGLVRSLSQLGAVVAILLLATWWVLRPVRKLVEAVHVVGRGNLDAHVPARTQDEIGDLGRAFNAMTAELRTHIEALTRETQQRESVESELRIAKDIQQSLLPHTFPPFPHRSEFDLHAVNVPARTVGGDFYDFFPVGERIAIIIADVSGKGVPAALLMAVSRTIIRNLATQRDDPGEVLAEANRLLAEDNQNGMFVTVFLGFYDPSSGRMAYANAAHVPPVLVARDRTVSVLEQSSGTIVGALDGERYGTLECTLNPGDMLVLVTDGVTEARPDALAGKDFYGEERLVALLHTTTAKTAESTCAVIVASVDEHAHGTRADDTTVLVLKRTI